MTQRRLIEETFPLKKVSADSRHEKNVRHGHISTLHIWPARRPLAACRAAIIAALLPDPGNEADRHALNKKIESITHWGTENGPALDFFRQEIRRAFGGRPPRVLDMFAGGGAIPLEAMRLGCEAIANDYNPVAWFILKCTLEFPQRLAGKTWPLPATNSTNDTEKNKDQLPLLPERSPADPQSAIGNPQSEIQGDLAAHVRYWGNWVLERAREELAPYYPTVDAQPTVAYLWARTVPCPDPACGAEVPLLKTLWLCKKEDKRRALRLVPDPVARRVNFEIWTPGPKDEVPDGTMAGAKSRCPVCGVNVTPDYIKACGHARKLGARMTAVVVDTLGGKEYRPPTPKELDAPRNAADALSVAAEQIPFGLPTESQRKNPRTLIVQLYGLQKWSDLFTPRQLLNLVTMVKWVRSCRVLMEQAGYQRDEIRAVEAYLSLLIDKVADRGSAQCIWISTNAEKAAGTYGRFALQMAWDFVEVFPWSESAGGAPGSLGHIAEYIKHALESLGTAKQPRVVLGSATEPLGEDLDAIVTDPPYYDAIPYSDLSDFFYVWLRRAIGDAYPNELATQETPKENELALRLPHADIPDEHTPAWYEYMMAMAFRRAWEALAQDGRLVIVFAHKDPQAWQTLTAALIEAGFTVSASWPIDTERGGRVRAQDSAALSSSIWLVCRKRPAGAGIGRYSAVRRAMQERITERLRYFWDIGISGPDFVWAAVGPALESYSAWDEVRRLDGSPFTVGEFLREVRRMVADFALGQILRGRSTEGLDEWTRYYLIHRNSFGLEDAPVGECILLSQGYGLDLNDVRGPRGLLVKGDGSDVRLAKWDERTRPDLGHPRPDGGLPLVDMLHRLLWLWASGDTDKLRAYAQDRGLAQNDLFWEIAQAVLEMAPVKSRERTLLEAVVAWGRGKPELVKATQPELGGLQ
ncbi:MAG: DUF1156 domain-containing protein [Chloroflexi bacterium]|nr:DUF1156 domain-containing protein [Chloroflexota bacterium]